MDLGTLVAGMELTRRSFLKFGLIAGAGLSLPTYLRSQLPAPFVDEVGPPPLQGPETWSPSVCTLCPAGCGLMIRVMQGKAVGLHGKAEHPVNKGKLCPRGLAGLQAQYHPDRLRGPARRVGKRSENRWEPITWDDAFKTISDRLAPLRNKGEAHRLGLLVGGTTPLTGQLLDRFGKAFGTPNVITLDWPMGQGPSDALRLMHGSPDWTYDLSHAEYIISFGFDWLQSFPSPVEASSAYGYLRRGRFDRRVRIVQVEARRSVTGIKADTWVPIKPGTEGVLALGMAHVLIAEGLYDKAFVEANTVGFEDWTDGNGTKQPGFKSVVLSDYSLEAVTALTGIPGEMIANLTHEYASRRPGLALVDRLPLSDQIAVHSLNILTGSIGVKGGVIQRATPRLNLDPELPPSIEPRIDHAGAPAYPLARSAAYHLPEIDPTTAPYPLDSLLMVHANPLFLSQEPARWVAYLESVPFIVSVSSFLDETALFADLILPESAPLEDWVDTPTTTLDGVPVFGVGKPVVKPLYDTRHCGDIVLQIAQGLGLSDILPWENFQTVIQEAMKTVHSSGKGTPLFPVGSEEPMASFDDFWEMVTKTGGWADASHVAPSLVRLDTPSGKLEWCTSTMHERLKVDMKTLLKPSQPTHTAGFPFNLCVYTPLSFVGGEGAHLPALQLIAGPHLRERWESWVEINPKTGSRLGIQDGDAVWVASSIGKIRAKARLFQGIRPDVVSMPFGLGHGTQGRWAEGIGVNPGAIVAAVLDPLAAHPLWQLTKVNVYKVEEGVV